MALTSLASSASMTTTPVSTPTRTVELLVGQVADRQRRQHGPLGRALGGREPEARRQLVARRRRARAPPRSTRRARAARRAGAAIASSTSGSTPLPVGNQAERDGDHADPAALALAGRRASPASVADSSWRRMRPSSSRNGGTRLEAELLAEPPAQRPERLQGVGLATDEVLRRHQLTGERLVQRVGLDRLLQLGQHLVRDAGARRARTAPAGRPAGGRRAGRRPAAGRGSRAGRRRRRPASDRGPPRRMAAARSSSARRPPRGPPSRTRRRRRAAAPGSRR